MSNFQQQQQPIHQMEHGSGMFQHQGQASSMLNILFYIGITLLIIFVIVVVVQLARNMTRQQQLDDAKAAQEISIIKGETRQVDLDGAEAVEDAARGSDDAHASLDAARAVANSISDDPVVDLLMQEFAKFDKITEDDTKTVEYDGDSLQDGDAVADKIKDLMTKAEKHLEDGESFP